MGGGTNNLWIVPILDDEAVMQALTCGRCLRTTKTCATVAALMSPSVSGAFVKELEKTFELIIMKDFGASDAGNETDPDSDKELTLDIIWSALSITAFTKLIVVHPEILVMRQSDHLFDTFSGQNGLVMKDEIGRKLGAGMCPTTKTSTYSPTFWEKWNTLKVEHLVDFYWNGKMEGIPDIVCTSTEELSDLELEATFLQNKVVGGNDSRQKNWIAVIGMACRFPGANSPEEYWNILESGQSAGGPLPASRVKLCDGIGTDALANFLKCRVDEFDAGFFGMSPSEAIFTDPQARLLLEVSWEAFEDAGINPQKLRGTNTAVFHGSWLQEYKEMLNEHAGGSSKNDFMRKYLGNGFGCTAAKLSFFYGFAGENVATESGCSSSMVAVNLACQSLQRRDCTLALASGANIILQMDENQKVLWSFDGKCKTFDINANGYARGEGVAVLVLKRYSDAIRDNDRIFGTIIGGATSQEGLSKNFGAPTIQSEENVMRSALDNSGIEPSEVDYVEAHATGTAVGDPIEAAAICNAYSSSKRLKPLMIASGKTNIGHGEAVSGLAGIIKVLLAMRHEKIPAHLHLTQMNPQINFDTIPGVVPLDIMPWPRNLNNRPRVAGISSFGMTGTDVHMIIQEPPHLRVKHSMTINNTGLRLPLEVIAFSAKTVTALKELETRYMSRVTPENISDVAFTVNTCRAHNLGYRKSILLSPSTGNVIHELSATNDSKIASSFSKPKVCFTFPGVIGSMDLTPARNLYNNCIPFRRTMDHCNSIWTSEICSTVSLNTMLNKNWNADESKPYAWYACILSIQYALAKLWTSWGIQADMVLGQCTGEITAAVICGAITLEDAFKILKTSEYLLACNKVRPGAMMALNCDVEACQLLIAELQLALRTVPWIDVASINSPTQTVVSASLDTLKELKRLSIEKGIKCHLLKVDYAAHSRFVEDGCRKAEKEIFGGIRHNPCGIPYISCATGSTIKEENLGQAHWFNMSRNTVQFTKACSAADKLGSNIYIEIGLGAELTALTVENLGKLNKSVCLSTFQKTKAEDGCWSSIVSCLANLYVSGVEIDWDNFYKLSPGRRKVDLPHYPFERKSFWFEKRKKGQRKLEEKANGQIRDYGNHPLLGATVKNCTGKTIYSNLINDKRVSFICDHLIGEHVIFPAACFMEIMTAAVEVAVHDSSKSFTLTEFKVHSPLLLNESKKTIQTLLWPENEKGEGHWIAQIYTDTVNQRWIYNASAKITVVEYKEADNIKSDMKLVESVDGRNASKTFYEQASSVGLRFGPKFRTLTSICRDETETVMQVEVPQDSGHYVFHPLTIDAMLQGYLAHTKPLLNKLHVPVQVGSFTLNKYLMDTVARETHIYVSCKTMSNGRTNEVNLWTSEGFKIAAMQNVEFVATSVEALLKAAGILSDETPLNIYDILWQPSNFHQPSLQINLSASTHLLESCEFQTLSKDLAIKNEFTFEEKELDNDMNQLCSLYVLNALYEMGWKPETGCSMNVDELSVLWKIVPGLVPAFKHFVTYLFEDNLLDGDYNKYLVVSKLPTPAQVKSEIKQKEDKLSLYPAMETIHPCGTQLAAILQGHTTGQRVLFANQNQARSSNLAEHYYRTARFGTVFYDLVKIFSCMSTELSWDLASEPIKILEIGAGTGSFTRDVIPVLKKQGIRYQYYFTDISPSFLGKAAENFQEDFDSFVFKTLNIEEDPLTQGFPPSYFDVVVAVDVLHATRKLPDTLNYVERLTKNGGRALILETEKPVREVDICFGILDGYWLFDDGIRTTHCTVSGTTWLQLLAERGFNSDACVNYACQDQVSLITCRLNKMMQKIPVHVPESKSKKWILMHNVHLDSESTAATFHRFVDAMAGLDRWVSLLSIHTIFNQTAKLEHILDSHNEVELEGIIYCVLETGNMEPISKTRMLLEPFQMISKYLMGTRRFKSLPQLYLVTRGCWQTFKDESYHVINGCTPSLLWGFARTLRMELPGIISKSIDIDINHKKDCWVDFLLRELWLDDKETEICYRGDQRLYRRLNRIPGMEGKAITPVFQTLERSLLFNDSCTYFISGGKGVIGMEVAKWMISNGAKYLILGGRSPPTENVKQIIQGLERDSNCKVICRQIDTSEYNQCKELIKTIEADKDLPPLRGIHHCAGILSDKLIAKQDWENIDQVLSAKVHGALNLHVITTEMNIPLDFFVLYSSMCCTFGNIGQSAYTAANAFMDSLAEMRRSMGLAALSINWGKWNIGLASSMDVDLLLPFSLDKGIQALEHLMIANRNLSGKGLVAAGIFNAKNLLKVAPYYEKTLLEHVQLPSKKEETFASNAYSETEAENSRQSCNLKEAFTNKSSYEERFTLVRNCVIGTLCETLGISENEVVENTTFSDMGMDSLMSIEFTNKLLSQIDDHSTGFIDIEEHSTVLGICQHLITMLEENAITTQT